MQHPVHELKTHFITRESYQDALLSAHSAVMLIIYMRDNFPNQECHLGLTGSDCCEEFFSINGQWIGNRHAYNYGTMAQNVSHMIRLQTILVNENAPNWAKAHVKQENVWAKQFPVDIPKADLKQYPAPGEEIEAWKAGIEMAKAKAREVGIALEEDGHVFHFRVDGNPVDLMASEEELEATRQSTAPSVQLMDDDTRGHAGHDDSTLPQDELERVSEVLNEALNDQDDEESQSEPELPEASSAEKQKREIVQPTINVPGHGVQYKSTLVRLLNENPKLPVERLRRVQHRKKQTSTHTGDSEQHLCLFEDYAVYESGAIKLVRIARMRRKCDRTFTDYKRPVPMNDPVIQDLLVTVNVYLASPEGEGKYTLNNSECREMKGKDIKCPINLEYSPLSGYYEANTEELQDLARSIEVENEQKKTDKESSKQKRKRPAASATEDGSFRTLVEPSVASDGQRRSSRVRTSITYLS